MSVDEESSNDIVQPNPKTFSETRDNFIFEDSNTTVAKNDSETYIDSSNLSLAITTDEDNPLANCHNNFLDKNGQSLHEMGNSQNHPHGKRHLEVKKEVERNQINTKCVYIIDISKSNNTDNRGESLPSSSTVAIDISENALVGVENSGLCGELRTDCERVSSNLENSSPSSTQTNRQECAINVEEHSENAEDGLDVDENNENGESVCRICHCGEDVETLISPCLCIGSMRFVHHSCLMNWLQRSVKARCEICLHSFSVRRKTKSFKKWRLPDGKPIPIIWMVTFVCALTLNVASITKDATQRCTSNACIVFYVLGAIGALLGLAFFYHWFKKSIRYIQKWIALNEEWTLVGPRDLSKIGYTNPVVVSRKLTSENHQDGTEIGTA